MRTRSILAVAIAFVALVAAAIVFWPHEPKPAGKERITVAQVGDFFLYLPLYYAKEAGYFDREGLDVRIVDSGGDDKSVAAVISGSADFGVGDPTFASIANEQGQQVRVIGAVVNGVPFWGVTKRPALERIDRPAQLQGLTVATFPKPSTAYVLQSAMFEKGGLKPRIREAQFGSLLPLLDTGAVDIVLELEPNVSTAVANGAHVVYSLAEQYPDFTITGVTVLQGTIDRRPETVRKFIRALDAAERAAHAEPEKLVAFARKRFPDVPPAVAEAAARRMLSADVIPQTAKVSATGWKAAIDLRIANGDIKDGAATSATIDNQFVP